MFARWNLCVDLLQLVPFPNGNIPSVCVLHKTIEGDGSGALNTNNAIVAGIVRHSELLKSGGVNEGAGGGCLHCGVQFWKDYR